MQSWTVSLAVGSRERVRGAKCSLTIPRLEVDFSRKCLAHQELEQNRDFEKTVRGIGSVGWTAGRANRPVHGGRRSDSAARALVAAMHSGATTTCQRSIRRRLRGGGAIARPPVCSRLVADQDSMKSMSMANSHQLTSVILSFVGESSPQSDRLAKNQSKPDEPVRRSRTPSS